MRIWFIEVPRSFFGWGQSSLSREVCNPIACIASIIWQVWLLVCVVGKTGSWNKIEVLVSAESCNCCNRSFKNEESKLEWFRFFCKVEANKEVWAWDRSVSAYMSGLNKNELGTPHAIFALCLTSCVLILLREFSWEVVRKDEYNR